MRINDHSILWYLQPVQVLCLTIKQAEQMGLSSDGHVQPSWVFFFPPHTQSGCTSCSTLCSCIIAASTNRLPSPSYLEHVHMACSAVLLYFSACHLELEPLPHLCALLFACMRARVPPSRPSKLEYDMYVMKCLTAQHGSRSARTAETQHIMGVHHRPV